MQSRESRQDLKVSPRELKSVSCYPLLNGYQIGLSSTRNAFNQSGQALYITVQKYVVVFFGCEGVELDY